MMKTLRPLLCLLMALVTLLSATFAVSAADPAGLNNFSKSNTYSPGSFRDVNASDWFADSVAESFSYGILKGKAPDRFDPNGNVTLAEAVAISARLHSIYHTGVERFHNGTPWYQPYVDYALKNGILKETLKDYTRAATRAEFASIICAAFPQEALSQNNMVVSDSIPDVPSQLSNAAIYQLYGAGILTGSDDKGTFYPNSNIRRSEVAAITVRMVDPAQRKPLPPGMEAASEAANTANQQNAQSGTVRFTFYEAGTITALSTNQVSLLCTSYQGSDPQVKKSGWTLNLTVTAERDCSKAEARLSAGTYNMTIIADGYQDKAITLSIVAGNNSASTSYLFPSRSAATPAAGDAIFVHPDENGSMVPLENGVGTLNGPAFAKFYVRDGKFDTISPNPKAGYYDLEVVGTDYDSAGFRWYKYIEDFYVSDSLKASTVVCEKCANISFFVHSVKNTAVALKNVAITIKSGNRTIYQLKNTTDNIYLPAGEYIVTVSAEGYLTESGTIIVTQPSEFMIALTPTVPASNNPSTPASPPQDAYFVYYNDANSLIPIGEGRGVLMWQMPDGQQWDYPFTIKNGFIVEDYTLPAGNYELEIYSGDTNAAGFSCRGSRSHLRIAKDTAANEIIFNQLICDYVARVTFAVKDENGCSIFDCNMTIQDASGNAIFTSDDSEDPAYLSKGTYTLLIQANRYQPYSRNISISGTEAIEVVLQKS